MSTEKPHDALAPERERKIRREYSYIPQNPDLGALKRAALNVQALLAEIDRLRAKISELERTHKPFAPDNSDDDYDNSTN